jgi:hypothetical protein
MVLIRNVHRQKLDADTTGVPVAGTLGVTGEDIPLLNVNSITCCALHSNTFGPCLEMIIGRS